MYWRYMDRHSCIRRLRYFLYVRNNIIIQLAVHRHVELFISFSSIWPSACLLLLPYANKPPSLWFILDFLILVYLLPIRTITDICWGNRSYYHSERWRFERRLLLLITNSSITYSATHLVSFVYVEAFSLSLDAILGLSCVRLEFSQYFPDHSTFNCFRALLSESYMRILLWLLLGYLAPIK